jgi:hypothetical protein
VCSVVSAKQFKYKKEALSPLNVIFSFWQLMCEELNVLTVGSLSRKNKIRNNSG